MPALPSSMDGSASSTLWNLVPKFGDNGDIPRDDWSTAHQRNPICRRLLGPLNFRLNGRSRQRIFPAFSHFAAEDGGRDPPLVLTHGDTQNRLFTAVFLRRLSTRAIASPVPNTHCGVANMCGTLLTRPPTEQTAKESCARSPDGGRTAELRTLGSPLGEFATARTPKRVVTVIWLSAVAAESSPGKAAPNKPRGAGCEFES